MNLREDVIYQSLKKVAGEWHAGHIQWRFYYDYLRFNKDGDVIFCSDQSDDISSMKNWFCFSKERVGYFYGKYTINESKIDIVIEAAVGAIKYQGEICKNSIILNGTNKELNFSQWDLFTSVN